MRVLIVGSGGREHALSWRIEQSPSVEHVYIAPGNGGTGCTAKSSNVVISANDFKSLVSFAVENKIDLVIPGPEQPLVDGIQDHFRRVGIPVFGPSPAAAQMEGSKAFSKAFMKRHGIPTAAFETFDDFEKAKQYIETVDHEVVLKASGLAAGKGVLIPESKSEALEGLKLLMKTKEFGSAGDEVVVEERLFGQELSILALSDGYTVIALPGAQDHKRIGDGDVGLNTGGMGAYAPTPTVSSQLQKICLDTVIQPTIDGMRKDGIPFVGCLFAGFMMTSKGPKVLEYNVRFGDPETQTLLPLLSYDTDLAEVLLAAAEHRLDSVSLGVKPGYAVTVVLASEGYPNSYLKNIPISISKEPPPSTYVFHAGTAIKEGQLVTSGGRVAAITAVANTLEEAVANAYEGCNGFDFKGKTMRRDIAYRAMEPSSSTGGEQTLTYADAGVSIDSGNQLVKQIKNIVKSTARPGCSSDIGGFGALFELSKAGLEDPILVSGTDGVGTKLIVAQSMGKHDTIGIDLVAMSVNDLVVQGAEPLFFLDYFACSKLDIVTATDVIKGIADGCLKSGCALVGGETAEMPGLYSRDDYDLAGFAVGAVERSQLLPLPGIKDGDLLVGLASSGPHSNGYSLIRKVLTTNSINYTSSCPWDPSRTIGQILLIPTQIYVKQLLPATRKKLIKALSHITGGGFLENIPRVLPKGLGCIVDVSTYSLSPFWTWLMKVGHIDSMEMCRTFNCGIGMVAVVGREIVDEVVKLLKENGDGEVMVIGSVKVGEGVEMKGLDSWK